MQHADCQKPLGCLGGCTAAVSGREVFLPSVRAMVSPSRSHFTSSRITAPSTQAVSWRHGFANTPRLNYATAWVFWEINLICLHYWYLVIYLTFTNLICSSKQHLVHCQASKVQKNKYVFYHIRSDLVMTLISIHLSLTLYLYPSIHISLSVCLSTYLSLSLVPSLNWICQTN